MPEELTNPTQQTPTVAAPAEPAAPPAKTFTQAEVDEITERRLARAKKGMPNEAELVAFRKWRDESRTEEERRAAIVRERDDAVGRVAELEAQIEQLKRDAYLAGKGLQGDEAEFIAYKAAKMVSEKVTFAEAVDSLIAERQQKPAFSWTAPLAGSITPESVNSTMNALIRQARR